MIGNGDMKEIKEWKYERYWKYDTCIHVYVLYMSKNDRNGV